MRLEADNDNRRRRTRADEQYDMMVIMLGLSALFIAAMWLASWASLWNVSLGIVGIYNAEEARLDAGPFGFR
jgi:hypothetical protein